MRTSLEPGGHVRKVPLSSYHRKGKSFSTSSFNADKMNSKSQSRSLYKMESVTLELDTLEMEEELKAAREIAETEKNILAQRELERCQNGGATWKGARIDSHLTRGHQGNVSNYKKGKEGSSNHGGDIRPRGRMTKDMLAEDLRSLKEERLAREQQNLNAELSRQRKAPAGKRKSCKEIEQIQKELQAARQNTSVNNNRENSAKKNNNVPINNNGFKFLEKKNVLEWSITDSLEWLQWLNLQQYSPQFAENKINGPILLEVSHEDLDYMKIKILAHRKILLKGINDLNMQMKNLQNKDSNVPQNIQRRDEKEIKVREFQGVMKEDTIDNQALNINLLEQEEKKLFQEAVSEWRSMKGKQINIVREYKGEGEGDSNEDDPFQLGRNTAQKKKEYEEALLKEQEENLKIKPSFSLMNNLISMEERKAEGKDNAEILHQQQEEKTEKSWHNPFYTGQKENISDVLESIDKKVDYLNQEKNVNANAKIEDTEAHYAKIEAEEHALFEDAVLQWRNICSRSENRNDKIRLVHANKDGNHKKYSPNTSNKNNSTKLLAQNISQQLDIELQNKKEQYELLKTKLMSQQEQCNQDKSKLEGKEKDLSAKEEIKEFYSEEVKESYDKNNKKHFGYFAVPENNTLHSEYNNGDQTFTSGVTNVRILNEERKYSDTLRETKEEEKVDSSERSNNILTGVTYSVTMAEDGEPSINHQSRKNMSSSNFEFKNLGLVQNIVEDEAVVQTPRITFLD